jgi:hypothetical protein
VNSDKPGATCPDTQPSDIHAKFIAVCGKMQSPDR